MPLVFEEQVSVLSFSALSKEFLPLTIDNATQSMGIKPFEFANISVDFRNILPELEYGTHFKFVVRSYSEGTELRLPVAFLSNSISKRRLFYFGFESRRYGTIRRRFHGGHMK